MVLHGTSSLQSILLLGGGAVDREDGVGIKLNYKYDQKLFQRNADLRMLTECLFAEDGALLASTTSGAEKATREYQETCSDFSLMVSNSISSVTDFQSAFHFPLSTGLNLVLSLSAYVSPLYM